MYCLLPQELAADEISPGVQLSAMLPDILLDAPNLTTLSLARNNLDDAAICRIMEALAANKDIQLQHLDLSGNQLLAEVRCDLMVLIHGFLLTVIRACIVSPVALRLRIVCSEHLCLPLTNVAWFNVVVIVGYCRCFWASRQQPQHI